MRSRVTPAYKAVTLVLGYHSNTPFPEEAKESGLLHRFAVVLHTDYIDIDYMYFDAILFCKIIEEIARFLSADAMHVVLEDGTCLLSLEELRMIYERTQVELQQPPIRIKFFNAGELLCIEETEFWVVCGGVQPYSDSYTASFYTRHDTSLGFIAACFDATGSSELQIIKGSKMAAKPSWWKRISQSYIFTACCIHIPIVTLFV